MTQSLTDIPQPARDMAKRCIGQSRAAYDQFMEVMAGAMEAWGGGVLSSQSTPEFRAIQDRTLAFAKQNAEATFALANDVTNAKDFQEVLALQGKYALKQMQSYVVQSQEVDRLSARLYGS